MKTILIRNISPFVNHDRLERIRKRIKRKLLNLLNYLVVQFGKACKLQFYKGPILNIIKSREKNGNERTTYILL